MTDPSRPRPVPGPPRPGPVGGPAPVDAAPVDAAPVEAAPVEAAPEDARVGDGSTLFADLDQRPVAEHVAVFEAEHARLQRELGTIDQL
jgi:hypothetical protein